MIFLRASCKFITIILNPSNAKLVHFFLDWLGGSLHYMKKNVAPIC